jgi:hypothetical protein
MHEENHFAQRAELERELLRALCAVPGTATFKTATQELAEYEWQSYENRIVFQALQSVLDHDSLWLREELAARTTRAGFPDLDWSFYFQSSSARTDLGALLRSLKEMTGWP